MIRNLYELPDHSQVLVLDYANGRQTIAFRENGYASWGPPLMSRSRQDDEAIETAAQMLSREAIEELLSP